MRLRIRMLAKASVQAPADIAGVTMPVILDYDPCDPLAVRLTFCTEYEESVAWVIGRDLLRGGLHAPTGLGDVRVWPGSRDRTRYYLQLRTDASCTLFAFESRVIEAFLAQAYQSVPAAAELSAAVLDAELDAIFGAVG